MKPLEVHPHADPCNPPRSIFCDICGYYPNSEEKYLDINASIRGVKVSVLICGKCIERINSMSASKRDVLSQLIRAMPSVEELKTK